MSCIQGHLKPTDICAYSSCDMSNKENTDTQLTSLSAFISGNDIGSGPSPTSASKPSSTLTVTSWPEVVGQVSLHKLCPISGTGVML